MSTTTEAPTTEAATELLAEGLIKIEASAAALTRIKALAEASTEPLAAALAAALTKALAKAAPLDPEA